MSLGPACPPPPTHLQNPKHSRPSFQLPPWIPLLSLPSNSTVPFGPQRQYAPFLEYTGSVFNTAVHNNTTHSYYRTVGQAEAFIPLGASGILQGSGSVV